MFQRWRPGDKAEAEAVVDHGEASGGEGYPLAVDPSDMLAARRRLVGKAGLRRDPRRGGFQFAPAKSVKKVAGEEDTLALAAGEPFLDMVVDAGAHRLTYLTAKAAFGQGDRFLCNELAVKPGRALRRHLSLDGEIRADGDRELGPSGGILEPAQFDDRARR